MPLFLGQRVEARVLDRHGRLERKRLCTLHLVRREPAVALPLGQDGGADGLTVGDQGKGHERSHAECPHVRWIDLGG